MSVDKFLVELTPDPSIRPHPNINYPIPCLTNKEYTCKVSYVSGLNINRTVTITPTLCYYFNGNQVNLPIWVRIMLKFDKPNIILGTDITN